MVVVILRCGCGQPATNLRTGLCWRCWQLERLAAQQDELGRLGELLDAYEKRLKAEIRTRGSLAGARLG